ncbi:MAG: Gfo/Idh/MocA family oxidoreductase [Planctomycetia bacterium]|nr:Gfo/Idh/MocA family oxidoreductase [Planctomycetia bacterium]
MRRTLSRREFLERSSLAGAAALGAGFFAAAGMTKAESRLANEKLNIAVVGIGGQGSYDLSNVASENIVALCDVDDQRGGPSFEKFPQAARYKDFRKLLEERKDIDAVVVATPDHIHAPASVMAMKLGKHVYCEKPLTHSVYESRVVAQTAAKQKVATQLGTQIHAGENYRRVVEIIQSGAIGPVEECHVWVGKAWGGGERPQEMPPVPKHLDWDLWLGPAPQRAYHPTYVPANWRRWWDFGSGTLGDMGCHYMDLPFWALKLRRPTTVESEGLDPHAETAPLGIVVRYEFPARKPSSGGELPALKLTWHDGEKHPKELHGIKVPDSGVLFVGKKGTMFADYNGYKLYPESDFAGFAPPEPTIPRSIGHHREWIEACKSGGPTTCNFDYSGALSEAVLLGLVAYRAGKKLAWDAEKLTAMNCPEAERFLRREYRSGWTL